jgi:glycosyltransferase involved in cell wall biosynthesis
MPVQEPNSALLILGMHRSGTSALTGALSLAGIDPGPSLLPAAEGINPKGFWEHREVVAIHERLLVALGTSWDDERPLPRDWWLLPVVASFRDELTAILRRDFSSSPLWILKDPRLCRLIPMWLQILQGLEVKPHFIICLRHPLEVASSLELRDEIQQERSCLLWLEHLIESEHWTRGYARMIISYERLLEDWRTVIQDVVETFSLDLRIDEAAAERIDAFLETTLRHHLGQLESPSIGNVSRLAMKTYMIAANEHINQLADRLSDTAEVTARMAHTVAPWVVEISAIKKNNIVLESQLAQYVEVNTAQEFEIARIKTTVSWRISKPFRLIAFLWRRRTDAGIALVALARYPNPLKLSRSAFRMLRLHGLAGFAQSLKNFFQGNLTYTKWIARNDTLSGSDRLAIAEHITMLKMCPLFSVLMPVFNTPEFLLRHAIESVREQLYTRWELCIADDASTEAHVWRVLEEYARLDERIRIVRREHNGHISAASNTCLDMAGGEFVAFLDHDDELAPHALYMVATALHEKPWLDMFYSDEDKIDENGQRFDPYFKPDWNPDLFTAQNFVCHLAVYRADVARRAGGFRVGFEGSQDWDLALRISESIPASHICHIPHVLYHWRAAAGSTALTIDEKPYAMEAGLAAVRDHFVRAGNQTIVSKATPTHLRVRYALPSPPPFVSIIIPTRNCLHLLRRCIDSLREKTRYSNYEILLVDNQSDDPAALSYLDSLERTGTARVLRYDKPFNFSAINNFAVKETRGNVLCLLNNDTEIISADWLEEMVSQAMRPEIGIVGAMLYYPDDSIQHAGITLGIGGVAGHLYHGSHRGTTGYMNRACLVQNLSAVTGACMAIRKSVYVEIGGMDERNLTVAYNDVDLSLKAIECGYRNLWTPFAELYHHESASRGADNTREKSLRFQGESIYMLSRWKNLIENDPAHNPNLTLNNSWPYFAPFSRAKKPWLSV